MSAFFIPENPTWGQIKLINRLDFPGGSDGKASVYNAGDLGSVPGSGRFPGEGNGNPLQYSCLEKSHGRRNLVSTGSQRIGARLSDFTQSLTHAAAAAAKLLQSCPILRPYRRQPTRLLRSWHFPGKSTGVVCHCLLHHSLIRNFKYNNTGKLEVKEHISCKLIKGK